VIVNYPPPYWAARAHHAIFRLGPFRDERQPIYWYWRRYPEGALVPVRMFTGALMSFRRDALAGLRHDARYRAASVGEDIDLCWSLRRARRPARHRHRRPHRPQQGAAPAKRPEEAVLTSWGFLYDKHVPEDARDPAGLRLVRRGRDPERGERGAAHAARGRRSRGVEGLRSLWSDYAGSTFLAPRARAS